MPKSFIFGGRNANTYNVFASCEAIYDTPTRRIKSVQIPGRNGDLIIDEGTYNNINVKYRCVMPYGFQDNVNGLRNWLSGAAGEYNTLKDEYDTTHFRLGCFTGQLNFEPMYTNQSATTFDVNFNCKPQRYLNSGANNINIPRTSQIVTLTNPTNFDAHPRITVTDIRANDMIMVGTIVITALSDYNSTVTIDTETGEIRMLNTDVSSGFSVSKAGVPVPLTDVKLGAGNTSVRFTSSYSYASCAIAPRWWEL